MAFSATRRRAAPCISAGVAALALVACTLPAVPPSAQVTPEQRWGERAVAGDTAAQYRLGRELCCEVPAHRDLHQAAAWLCRAASSGHREAMVLLAQLYAGRVGEAGRDAVRDFANAYGWYTVAAGQGDDAALAARDELGNMLERDAVMAGKRLATHWRTVQCPPIE